MANVSKIFIRLNEYDTAIVNPAIKPAQGDLAAMRLTDGRFVLNRVTGSMQGVAVLGRVVEIRRSYEHGTPPLTMADVRDERSFYNILQEFEQLLYRGLLKAERQYSFIDYQRITDYFFKRLNRAHWDGKRRRWNWQEGVQC